MRHHLHLRCNAYFRHPLPCHHHTVIPLTYLLDACMHRVGRVGRVSGWGRSPSAACFDRTREVLERGIGTFPISLTSRMFLRQTHVSAATRHHLPPRCNTDFRHPHLRHHHTYLALTYLLDAWHAPGWVVGYSRLGGSHEDQEHTRAGDWDHSILLNLRVSLRKTLISAATRHHLHPRSHTHTRHPLPRDRPHHLHLPPRGRTHHPIPYPT